MFQPRYMDSQGRELVPIVHQCGHTFPKPNPSQAERRNGTLDICDPCLNAATKQAHLDYGIDPPKHRGHEFCDSSCPNA